MEPHDLIPPSPDDRDLAALFGPAAPLPDDGFSIRVLTALPARQAARAEWRRWILCTLGALIGFAIALPRVHHWPHLAALNQQINQRLAALSQASPSALLLIGLALIIAYAFYFSDREESWL